MLIQAPYYDVRSSLSPLHSLFPNEFFNVLVLRSLLDKAKLQGAKIPGKGSYKFTENFFLRPYSKIAAIKVLILLSNHCT